MALAKECCHPLNFAHSLIYSQNKEFVYVVCGYVGCTKRRKVTQESWEEIKNQLGDHHRPSDTELEGFGKKSDE